MLRLLPPLCWTGLIAYLGGALHPVMRKCTYVLEYAVLLVLAALGQRRTTS
jgi:hypothetical protein